MTKKFKEHLNESGLSRVHSQAQAHDTGTITAFRYAKKCGEGDKYSISENKARNKELKALLLRDGFGVTSIKGSYVENYGTPEAVTVSEESFFVVDIKDTGNLRKALIKYGARYEQDSITFAKAGASYALIGTNNCPNGYPGKGKEISLGAASMGNAGMFFSKVKNRPFVFKEAELQLDTLSHHGWHGGQAIIKIAEAADAHGND